MYLSNTFPATDTEIVTSVNTTLYNLRNFRPSSGDVFVPAGTKFIYHSHHHSPTLRFKVKGSIDGKIVVGWISASAVQGGVPHIPRSGTGNMLLQKAAQLYATTNRTQQPLKFISAGSSITKLEERVVNEAGYDFTWWRIQYVDSGSRTWNGWIVVSSVENATSDPPTGGPPTGGPKGDDSTTGNEPKDPSKISPILLVAGLAVLGAGAYFVTKRRS